MIGNGDIIDMLFPKWLRVLLALILILAIIGGIDVVGTFMQFIAK